MKHAHLSFRHGNGYTYVCDVNSSDGRRVASVPMKPVADDPDDKDPFAMRIAERLLAARQLIEQYPPFKGRKKRRAIHLKT
jgi:hypothetical protein